MCWKCGKAILLDGPAGRTMTCASCGADIRVCKNCRFWSPGAWHDCSEAVDDPVSDKERANFCGFFQLEPSFRNDHAVAGKNGSGASGGNDGSRAAFDNLFGE